MDFKHKIVNDLAWVIGSAPLMSINSNNEGYECISNEWIQEEYQRCNTFLLAEDSSPERLESFMGEKGSQLLGKRFERFIEYWLLYSDRFEIITANLPIRNDKITVGEIDYVIKEISTGELIHLEVACKYYLGYDNSKIWANWKGINASDRLEDKMTKFDRQLDVFNTSLGESVLLDLEIQKPQSYLLMKGFFFYYWKSIGKAKQPNDACKDHNSGIYIRENEMSEFFKGNSSWMILKKQNWFSSYSTSNSDEILSEYVVKSKISKLISTYGFGVMLARLIKKEGVFVEEIRVAVVLRNWPEKKTK